MKILRFCTSCGHVETLHLPDARVSRLDQPNYRRRPDITIGTCLGCVGNHECSKFVWDMNEDHQVERVSE